MPTNKIKRTFTLTCQQDKTLMKVVNAVMRMGSLDEGRALELIAEDAKLSGLLRDFMLREEANAVDLKIDKYQVEGEKRYDF